MPQMPFVQLLNEVYNAPDARYEYDGSDNPIYIGVHNEEDAATDDTNWTITKLTWSGGNLVRKQKTVGAWTARAGLF